MLIKLDPKARYHKVRQVPKRIASAEDFDSVVDHAVLGNTVPAAPFIDRSTKIVSIGSCFAVNISTALNKSGYAAQLLNVNERLFNPFALQTFLEAVRENADISVFEKHWSLQPGDLEAFRASILQGKAAIVTLGLSFVWIDNATGEMVFDPTRKVGVNLISADPERFQMEATGVAENTDAIAAIINALRAMNPTIKIILTLSPVHLARAISDYPASIADSISKSTLRCALHEIMSLRLHEVYYFPSFEILRWLVPMVDVPFGGDQDIRHISTQWVDYTVSKFRQYYCIGEQAILPPYTPRNLIAPS